MTPADEQGRRPFGGTTARDVVAKTLAQRSPFGPRDTIGRSDWATAAAVLADLRAAGFTVRTSRRTAAS